MSRKFTPKINYLTEVFHSLEPLNVYPGEKIREMYIDGEISHYKELDKYPKPKDMISDKGYTITGWDTTNPIEEIKDFTRTGHRQIQFKPFKYKNHDSDSNNYYYDNSQTREFSLTPHVNILNKQKLYQNFEIKVQQDLKNISHKKFAKDTDNFLYFVIPQDIIEKYMTSKMIQYPGCKNIITSKYSRDYLRLRKFIDEVESTDNRWVASNWIPIMDKYDDKYDEIYYFGERLAERGLENLHKPKHMMKWRNSFFPAQYISTKEYGLLWPVINKGQAPLDIENQLLHSGSHRLLTLSLSKISQKSIEKGICMLYLPQFFDGDHLIFEIFINDKNVVVRKSPTIRKGGKINLKVYSEIVDEFTYE